MQAVIEDITRIMREVKYASLSLKCKNYTALWLDNDNSVLVKEAYMDGTTKIWDLERLPQCDLETILDDLREDYE